MILISEDNLERAIRKFFQEAKLPKKYSDLLSNYCILKKSVPAFIEALKEIDKVIFAMVLMNQRFLRSLMNHI